MTKEEFRLRVMADQAAIRTKRRVELDEYLSDRHSRIRAGQWRGSIKKLVKKRRRDK